MKIKPSKTLKENRNWQAISNSNKNVHLVAENETVYCTFQRIPKSEEKSSTVVDGPRFAFMHSKYDPENSIFIIADRSGVQATIGGYRKTKIIRKYFRIITLASDVYEMLKEDTSPDMAKQIKKLIRKEL